MSGAEGDPLENACEKQGGISKGKPGKPSNANRLSSLDGHYDRHRDRGGR